MKSLKMIWPLLLIFCNCYTGSFFEDPNVIKGERYTNCNMGLIAIIRDSGETADVDIFVDDVKITSTQKNSISFIQQPKGTHYVIFEIREGEDKKHTSAYCIDTFQVKFNDTTPIQFNSVLNLSGSIINATIPEIPKSVLQSKVTSNQYLIRRCSLDSILGCMYGNTYNKLTCEHSSGSKFIKYALFDYIGLAFIFGFSNGFSDTNPLNIANGKNIGFNFYGMLNPHFGIGLRTAYFADKFNHSRLDYDGLYYEDPVSISQMEYSCFLRLFSGNPSKPNIFFEPGIGLITCSSTFTFREDIYPFRLLTTTANFDKFCISAHLGGKIGFFDLRTGFYFALKNGNSSALTWYNLNMGFSIESKHKFRCD
jgi:hypothetical protein